MTEAYIKSRVKYWVKKLALLGFSHYEIDVKVLSTEESEADLIYALADTHELYDLATLEFEKSWVSHLTKEQLDRVIVHELLHVAMRNHDRAVRSIQFLILSGAAEDLWVDHVTNERENLVERLAALICELAK